VIAFIVICRLGKIVGGLDEQDFPVHKDEIDVDLRPSAVFFHIARTTLGCMLIRCHKHSINGGCELVLVEHLGYTLEVYANARFDNQR
ncbi:MAG: hypothetical protein Q9226_009084, partial [Calogaya cf. arnoldii]